MPRSSKTHNILAKDNVFIEVNSVSKKFDKVHKRLQGIELARNEPVQALDNINFKLSHGETLGIIGNNGSGKTTLLKIISGLIKPDMGEIKYLGTLASILDIGFGFHPDLTGYENIILVGKLLGLSSYAIKEAVPSIVNFSELEEFMGLPVKYYSNGMFMRLAFSVLTSLNADIIVIDEVLSVGDLNFREKCATRIREMARSGSIIIIASHDMQAVQDLCSHALLLENGKQVQFNSSEKIINTYLTFNIATLSSKKIATKTKESQKEPLENARSLVTHIKSGLIEQHLDSLTLLEASVSAKGKLPNEEIAMDEEVEITFSYKKDFEGPLITSVVINDKFNHDVMSLCSYRLIDEHFHLDNSRPGCYEQKVTLPAGMLNSGIFFISIYFADKNQNDIAPFPRILQTKIIYKPFYFDIYKNIGNYKGPLFPFAKWTSICLENNL